MEKRTGSTFIKVLLMLTAFAAVTFTSCKKKESPAITQITYTNDTYTPITITHSGVTQVLDVGSTITYSGAYGSSLTAVATTSGTTSGGSQVGELITWNINDPFPSSGISYLGLDVPSDYVFLKIENDDSYYDAQGLYVNYQLTSPSYDNITIPHDGHLYDIGYYSAYTNTELRMNSSPTGIYWDYSPAFSFVPNQDYIWALP